MGSGVQYLTSGSLTTARFASTSDEKVVTGCDDCSAPRSNPAARGRASAAGRGGGSRDLPPGLSYMAHDALCARVHLLHTCDLHAPQMILRKKGEGGQR